MSRVASSSTNVCILFYPFKSIALKKTTVKIKLSLYVKMAFNTLF